MRGSPATRLTLNKKVISSKNQNDGIKFIISHIWCKEMHAEQYLMLVHLEIVHNDFILQSSIVSTEPFTLHPG